MTFSHIELLKAQGDQYKSYDMGASAEVDRLTDTETTRISFGQTALTRISKIGC